MTYKLVRMILTAGNERSLSVIVAVLITLLLLFFPVCSFSEIYQWKDESGNIVISDSPPPVIGEKDRKIKAGSRTERSKQKEDLSKGESFPPHSGAFLINHNTTIAGKKADDPTPFDKMDLDQIATFRKEKVRKYSQLNFFPQDYNPLNPPHNRIYGQITPKTGWVSPVLYYIANPYLLIILSRDNDVIPLNVFCPEVEITYSEGKITERHTGPGAVCWFETVFARNPPGIVYMKMVNAWDAGFHYVHLVENQSVNLVPASSADNVGRIAFSQPGFYHVGYRQKNNISPYDRRACITLKEKNRFTRLLFHLWRKQPTSVTAKPDLLYEVTVIP